MGLHPFIKEKVVTKKRFILGNHGKGEVSLVGSLGGIGRTTSYVALTASAAEYSVAHRSLLGIL